MAALGLALVHLGSVRLKFLDRIPRSRWLSFAGGVAVALVFLEILPGLGESQAVVEQRTSQALGFLKNHVYIIAVLGLATFYGVERVVKRSRRASRDAGGEDVAADWAFWLSMSTYSAKNAIVGYLLAREPRPLSGLALFTLAIALEFLLSDRGLHRDHKTSYDRVGRWVLIGALGAGWMLGALSEVPELGLRVLDAFLAGSIVLTVLKEELPEDQDSRFWAFALGLFAYGALLLIQ